MKKYEKDFYKKYERELTFFSLAPVIIVGIVALLTTNIYLIISMLPVGVVSPFLALIIVTKKYKKSFQQELLKHEQAEQALKEKFVSVTFSKNEWVQILNETVIESEKLKVQIKSELHKLDSSN